MRRYARFDDRAQRTFFHQPPQIFEIVGPRARNAPAAIGNLYSADRSEIIWTPDDLARLCAVASREIAWAAKLACLTGLRQGDLLKLSWGQVGRHAIEMATGKSRGRKRAVVPLTAECRALLEEIKKVRTATTVLTNSRRQPWRSGFAVSWNKAMIAAGLHGKNLHFHDLRGTAATNFYRAGLTTREIAEIMAWSEELVERLIDRYVKRDVKLADRIRRMERASTENEQSATSEGAPGEQKL